MNLTVLLIASLIIILAIGLSIRVAISIAHVNADLRAFSAFEGMHFEDCSLSSTRPGAERLPQSLAG